MPVSFPDRLQALLADARRAGLALPGRVVFGSGTVERLPACLKDLGEINHLFVVASQSCGPSRLLPGQRFARLLKRNRIEATWFTFSGEPSVEQVDLAAECCRESGARFVVGMGGGSVVDCAKAVAGMATEEGSVFDYLEGVGTGIRLSGRALACCAIPTVSGTGAEMTRNAVITVKARRVKRSLRDQSIMPSVALVDSDLTATVPSRVRAAAGMDALTQLIESTISTRRRPETTELALEGLRPLRKALLSSFRNPEDSEAREGVAFSASLSGICLANSGLGLVHGIAAGLGGHRDVPHGVICAVLLPHVLRHNRDAVAAELATSLSAFLGTEARSDTIDDGIRAIEDLKSALEIPDTLSFLGLSELEIRDVARDSMGSSMSGNPIPMTEESVTDFLRRVA